MKRPSLKSLVGAAKRAAAANAKAGRLTQEWADLFEARYGHNDISDALVEVVDYSTGELSIITEKFIEEHSGEGQSWPTHP